MASTTANTQRKPPTLLDVLGQYGIFDVLCRRLDTATLFSLRLVTKRLADNYAAHARERWNINRRLKHFVNNPQGLRSLMARYDALISGSFVLQFFDDTFWKESDLDIYVKRDSAAAFGTYLCRKEGYRHKKGSAEDDDYDVIGFIQVDTYLRGDGNTSDETKIQIISTRTIPARSILGCFSTTAVVNIMTWNAAYSMFPKMTFFEPRTQRRICYGPDKDAIQRQVDKYSKRGWGVAGVPLAGPRRVGDRQSWKVALDVTGVKPSSTPDYVLEHCFFVVCVVMGTHPEAGIEWESIANEYTSDVLKYTYTNAIHFDYKFFWRDGMRSLLHDYTMKELRKLDPEIQPDFLARPTEFPDSDSRMYNAVSSFMIKFIKPETWTFYDEEVPACFKEWEEQTLMGLEGSMADMTIA